jgi:choline dehydrogenase-like flavoprotein
MSVAPAASQISRITFVATDIWVLERVAHTLGTCRMGRNPDTSVVDVEGRSQSPSWRGR